jgi:tetratricopeptide (TPR) repeat protein
MELMSKKIESFTKKVPTKDEALRMETEGSKRIFLELKEYPKNAAAYAKKYNELVSDIASVIKSQYPGKVGEEEFITDVWGIMNSNLDIKYGANRFGYLHESIRTGQFDCDTSSFLVYDVAKKLGVYAEMISVPKHALIRTDIFFFETTTGEYYPLTEFPSRYPIFQALSEGQIQSITYMGIGTMACENGKNDEAIKDFTKAIELNPELADAYSNRGSAYAEISKFEEAIKDYTKAIGLNPGLAAAYLNRSTVYRKTGRGELAEKDEEKYKELSQ